MRLRVPFRLSYLLVPGLMLLVAVVQMGLVRTHNLTPWKGGGFGMFSTFDSPAARTLRVVIETAEGEAHAVNPEVPFHKYRPLNFPTEGALRTIAQQAAAREWTVYDHDQILEMRDTLPDRYRRQIRRAEGVLARQNDSTAQLPDLGRIAYRQGTSHYRYPGSTPAVLSARAEVWRLTYDTETKSVVGALVNSVTVQRP